MYEHNDSESTLVAPQEVQLTNSDSDLEVTPDLVPILAAAILDIAQQNVGKSYARSMRGNEAPFPVWSADNLEQLQLSVPDSRDIVNLVFERAAEIQLRTHRPRKIAARYLIGLSKAVAEPQDVTDSDEAQPFDDQFSELEQWPKIRAAVIELLDAEEEYADQSMLVEAALQQIVGSNLYDKVQNRLNNLLTHQRENSTNSRQKAAASMYNELLELATKIDHDHKAFPVTSETIPAASAFILSEARTHNNLQGNQNHNSLEFKNDLESIQKRLMEIVGTEHKLVFVKTSGIARYGTLYLSLSDREATESEIPETHLDMLIYTASDKSHPSQSVSIITMWDTATNRDDISLMSSIGEEIVRPVNNNSLSESLDAAEHFRVLNKSIRTIEILSGAKGQPLPPLGEKWTTKLQERFVNEMIRTPLLAIYESVIRMIRDTEANYLSMSMAKAEDNPFDIVIEPLSGDDVLTSIGLVVARMRPAHPEQLKAALAVREIGMLKLAQWFMEEVGKTALLVPEEYSRAVTVGFYSYARTILGFSTD